MSSDPSHDRPISGAANVMLQVGAAAAILLLYLFILVSILTLLVVLAVELGILLALLRFGGAGFFIPLMQRHVTLMGTFFRSLWLGKSIEFRIPIKVDDAPQLNEMLKTICAKADVPLPRKVVVEMGVNAWVRMQGYRRGAGTTTLGIGFDLLAGLSQLEFEGVMAHEMMHAKLVQRGVRQLISGGVGRAAKLSSQLSGLVAAGRSAKKAVPLESLFAGGADRLTRLAVRQFAACSRQDEFDADRGAAELCGAAAVRTALLKLEGLNRIAARLPLRERIAQLESGQGFGQWLVSELASAQALTPSEAKAEAFNKYSTHPSMHDRLAALAAYEDQSLPGTSPALELLARPDEVAEKLVAEIQKQIVAQEATDSKQLDRWSRKTTRSRQLQPLQGVGLMVMIFGPVVSCCCISVVGDVVTGALALLTFAAGIVLIIHGRYSEKLALPVPDYSRIKSAAKEKLDATPERVKALEEELRGIAAAGKNQKKRLALMLGQSYEALERCDYVRAHVAARLMLEQDKRSIPCTLALAVAAGGLKQGLQVGQAVNFVRVNTGMRGSSPSWGAGWALLLVGDWFHAEAFLDQARQKKPGDPTVLALLAISQSRRNKLFSAIASARQACQPTPRNKEYSKLLIDLLLQGGFLREAHELLTPLVNEAATDIELMYDMVRLCLFHRNDEVAEQWAELARQSSTGPEKFVKLGEIYETARHDEQAHASFQLALQTGHYPEALLGLARLESNRQNKDQARVHLFAALDLLRPLGENSVGPLPLVGSILQQLKLLQDPILNCRAWIASLPGNITPPALANRSFLIYAPNSDEAKKSMADLLVAMQPEAPAPAINWRTAPKEQQPDGPVHAGIQMVLS